LCDDSHVVGKRNHERAIVRAHLVDKRDGRVANVLQIKQRRTTRVDQECDCEWIVDGSEVRDLLLDAVFENLEVLAPQRRHKLSIATNDKNRRVYECGLDANDVVRTDFLRRGKDAHAENDQNYGGTGPK